MDMMPRQQYKNQVYFWWLPGKVHVLVRYFRPKSSLFLQNSGNFPKIRRISLWRSQTWKNNRSAFFWI